MIRMLMKEYKKVFILIPAIIALIIYLAVWVTRYEYIVVSGNPGMVYQINRWTGSIRLLAGVNSREVVEVNQVPKAKFDDLIPK